MTRPPQSPRLPSSRWARSLPSGAAAPHRLPSGGKQDRPKLRTRRRPPQAYPRRRTSATRAHRPVQRLAAAEDETAPKSVAESIERVWLHSGSATVDLLFGRAMQAAAQKDSIGRCQFLDHVVEQAPDFTEGWSRRAFVHFQRNR